MTNILKEKVQIIQKEITNTKNKKQETNLEETEKDNEQILKYLKTLQLVKLNIKLF